MKKLHYIFFLSFLVLGNLSLYAQEKPVFVGATEGIKEYHLKNGLDVLLIPDATQSNAVVNIVYNVGSRHEGYGEKGMAHLLEHMLFKSTKNLGDIKKMLSEKGGTANGTTWYDRTNYYEIFPASDENLKWFIEMESDRMINATILQSDLDKEFSVVRNEFEIGENDPSGILMERIISTAFLWHNYGNSTIGSKEDIERVKADRLRVFYEKYYQPDNATLIVSGKFDESKALEYIGKYFAPIPKPTRIIDKTYTLEPAQDGERYVELVRSGDIQIAGAVYHTAPFASKDYAALDALIEILTSDPSGYMYKDLIETQKAASVSAWQPTTRDASYAYFSIEVPKDKNLDEAKNAFLNSLNKIATTKYTQEDLNRAKTKLMKDLENLQNNTLYLTINLTEIIGAGSYKLGFLYRDNVEALTLDDINRVAKNYFKNNNRTYGVFIPGENQDRVKTEEMDDEAIAKLTKDYKGREVEEENLSFETTIKNVVDHTTEGNLENGFKYAVLKKPIKGKKVIATLVFPVGDLKSLSDKSEIGELMGELLTAGTKSMTKEQIKDQLDKTKTNLMMGFGGQNFYISINTYQEYLSSTFDLIKQLLTDSTFPEAELSKKVLELKTMYEAYKNDPQSLAFNEVERLTSNYPKSHPYYTPTYDEKIASYGKVTRAQIVDFYNNMIGANHGYGTVVGDVDAASVKAMLESTFGKWNSKSPYQMIDSEYFASTTKTQRFDTPDKENAAAVGKINIKVKRDNPDYPALVLADQVLGSGGFLTARIPTRLRENEGISYGAGSFLNVSRKYESSSWGVYSFFNPTKVDVVESAIKDEINKAFKDGFTKEEMTKTITSWKNERKTSLGMDSYLATLINTHLFFGNPLEEFDTLEQQVDKLSVDDVNKVMKKYIDPSKLTLIIAGDFSKK